MVRTPAVLDAGLWEVLISYEENSQSGEWFRNPRERVFSGGEHIREVDSGCKNLER
ncbi:MAG: hypothetical protein H0X43_01605 [Nitrosospira sp.]|nr:hypothetical protein [Nitrosospira sp.]